MSPTEAPPVLVAGLLSWLFPAAFLSCAHVCDKVGAMEGSAVGPWPCPKGRGCYRYLQLQPRRKGPHVRDKLMQRSVSRVLQQMTSTLSCSNATGNAAVCKIQMVFLLWTLSPFISHAGSIHSDSIYLSKHVACLLIQTACSFFFCLRRKVS